MFNGNVCPSFRPRRSRSTAQGTRRLVCTALRTTSCLFLENRTFAPYDSWCRQFDASIVESGRQQSAVKQNEPHGRSAGSQCTFGTVIDHDGAFTCRHAEIGHETLDYDVFPVTSLTRVRMVTVACANVAHCTTCILLLKLATHTSSAQSPSVPDQPPSLPVPANHYRLTVNVCFMLREKSLPFSPQDVRQPQPYTSWPRVPTQASKETA